MTQGDHLERGLHRFRAYVVFGTGARSCLIDGLAREHAERDRDRERRRELGERSRDGVGKDIEMRGLAPDQAAKRHDGVETTCSRQHRDGRWELERAGDLELLDGRAGAQRRLNGPLGQRPRDFVVPPCANDRDARPATEILSPSRSLLRGRHLSQSSPRMRHCSVSE
jgi:hypothetical protein